MIGALPGESAMSAYGTPVAERSPRHIFLAPHYDDVALSCGGTVAGLADSEVKPLIVTVFGGTPQGPLTEFARDMHERWGVGPGDAVVMRRREEKCAERALGAESIWLDFLDAIYRGSRYTSDPDIFGELHRDETGLSEEVLDTLTERLSLDSDRSHIFYVPLAIGNHVDHQHTLKVGNALASAGFDVWAYEDFPYAGDSDWRDRIDQHARSATSGETRLDRLAATQIDRKVNAVLCYGSQLDIIFRHQGDPETSVRQYARIVGNGEPAERFWLIGR